MMESPERTMAGLGGMAHDALAMITYSDAPSVLLIADTDAAAARARSLLADEGARVRDLVSPQEALPFLDQQAAPTLAWAELEEEGADPFWSLLERLDREAAARRIGVIVSGPFRLIDSIAAATPGMAITHLCDPTPDECREAMAEARKRSDPRVGEVSRRPAPKLQHISQEINRLATMLAELSEEGAEAGEAGDVAGALIDAASIRSIIRARRLRERFFPGDLFADPAWDMMLDLMAARLEGRRVAVSSLCIAAAVPPTTALRWIKNLNEAGLFRRVADPQDGRRVHVELTEAAVAAFERYLQTVPRVSTGLFV